MCDDARGSLSPGKSRVRTAHAKCHANATLGFEMGRIWEVPMANGFELQPAGAIDAQARSQPAAKRVRWGTRLRGFTLLEIMLAVALIGLLSAALVSVAVHLADNRPRTAQEIFWEANHAARRTALKTEHEVQLSFDAKEKKFVVADGDATQAFPVPEAHDLTVDFLLAQATGGSLLIGGQLVDTHTLPAVSFYPDGTCSPFRIQFRVTGGPAHVIAIDPWTCAAVLSDAKSP